jgi:glucosyl-3-phosphoglycerate synthase
MENIKTPASNEKIENWVREKTFHHSQFSDIEELVRLKKKKGLTISLGLPTLNEEETIVSEILVLRSELMEKYPLIDELAVIDSGSTDRTCEFARQYGADVYKVGDHLKEVEACKGKGEALWRSLYILSGDIIIWIDADIKNIHPKFAYGLLGPLLNNDGVGYVKAFYERPLAAADGIRPTGGGRVTQLLVRPLLNAFFPDLSGFIQPLSGEYAGRREVLEQVPFFIGYGVETCLLIDIYEKFGLEIMAQVDLDRRVHRNRTLPTLTKMSFAILQAFCNRAESLDKIRFKEELNQTLRLFKRRGMELISTLESYTPVERPPMISLSSYRKKRKR